MTYSKLQGNITNISIFNGAAEPSKYITLNGSDLQAYKRYKFKGSVTVFGDIPENVRFDVREGKMIVIGNVSKGVRLNVQLPVNRESKKEFASVFNALGKQSAIIVREREIETGLKYPQDTDAAVRIEGDIAQDVKISTNGGIAIGGSASDSSIYKTGHGGKVEYYNPTDW